MKTLALVLLLPAAGLAAPAGPAARQAACREEFRLAVATNGVEAAEAAYARIGWPAVADPAAELAALEAGVGDREGFGRLRRDIRTKRRLLEPGYSCAAGDGTLPVPVVAARPVVPPVVDPPRVRAPAVACGPIATPFAAFAAAVGSWERRYMREKAFYGADGRKFVPDRGAHLGLLREKIDALGSGEAAAPLQDLYNARMESALRRRRALGGQGPFR